MSVSVCGGLQLLFDRPRLAFSKRIVYLIGYDDEVGLLTVRLQPSLVFHYELSYRVNPIVSTKRKVHNLPDEFSDVRVVNTSEVQLPTPLPVPHDLTWEPQIPILNERGALFQPHGLADVLPTAPLLSLTGNYRTVPANPKLPETAIDVSHS